MSICPLCNGMMNFSLPCSNCSGKLEDQGKISDYYDDYSPYMEIEWARLEDGIYGNYGEGQCMHLFKCPNCGSEHVEMIPE
mgnify:FL=1